MDFHTNSNNSSECHCLQPSNVFIAEESLVKDEVSTTGHDVLKTLQDDLRHFYVRSYKHLTPVPWNQHFVVELDKILRK